MRLSTKILLPAAGLMLLVSNAFGQLTGTTQLSVTVAAESAITVTTATTTLTEGGGAGFTSPFTGVTNLSYKIRTTKTGGTGSITVKVTSDFATGGPSVGSPVGSDSTTVSCTSSAGTACTGSPVVPGPSGTALKIVDFGADGHSAAAGSTASVNWTITNDPLYQEGSYTATATFTIATT